MTNIEKIRQEIERRLRDYSEDTQFEIGKRRGYKNILDFIDSLPEDHFRDSTKMVSKDLEEAAKDYAILPMDVGDGLVCIDKKEERAFIAGAKWMESQMPMPEDTVIFMKGVKEGRRLEREEREENKRKENDLPRFYGD